MRAALTFYRLLLHAFPAPFRARFGGDMADVFADRIHAARQRGPLAAGACVLRASADVIVQGTRERRAGRLARQARRARGSVARDVAFGWRMLCRHPGFATAAVVTLALGIGANVTTFSAVRAVLINSLPYAEPDRLVYMSPVIPRALGPSFTFEDFTTIRDHASAFAGVAGCSFDHRVVRGDGDPEYASVSPVTADFFRVFGATPLAGRLIGPGDFTADARPVVIAASVWESQFGRTRDIVGKTLRIDRDPWTVVGVIADEFAPECSAATVWQPLTSPTPNTSLSVFGRLKAGTTVEAARAQLTGVMAGRIDGKPYTGTALEPIGESDAASIRPGLLLLQGIAALLLLMACANVMNLFLAQATARRREFGVRAALGAGRLRLVRQLLTEAIVIATLGSALGFAVVYTAAPALRALAGPAMPAGTFVHIRTPELAIAMALAWFTTLVFGLVPALVAARTGALDSLRGGMQTTAPRGVASLRGGLIALQVVVAVTLLTGAGLLINSFIRWEATPLGFDPKHLVIARMPLDKTYDDAKQAAAIPRLEEQIRLALVPRPVTFAEYMPIEGDASTRFRAGAPGMPLAPVYAALCNIAPNYFQVLGISVKRGRGFFDSDTVTSARVAVVNDAFTRAFGADVLGGVVQGQPWHGSPPPAFTIVGVVADMAVYPTGSQRPTVYFPLAQGQGVFFDVAVRAADTLAVEAGLKAAVRVVDPDIPLRDVGEVESVLNARGFLARRRFFLWTLSVVAGLAMTLAALGVYSVTAHVTGLRMRELAIRLSLGARPRAIKALVIRQALRPVLVGVAGGLVAAWWAAGIFGANAVYKSFLFQITPHDGQTFAAVAVGLALVALFACWLPAWRTSRVDPVSVLKTE